MVSFPTVDPESTTNQKNETIFDVFWLHKVYNPFFKRHHKTIEN